MSGLTLTLRSRPPQRVDCSPLVPERLAGLSVAEVERTEVLCGTRRVAVGDLFSVAAASGEDLVIASGDGGDRLDRIGHAMASGRIVVEGEAGAQLGLGLAGGEVAVSGGAGLGAATGMRRGLVTIGGDAGDALGGALPGAMTGMSGGTAVVRGSAGARAGDRMRRGAIVVEGDLGDYPCSRMIAGTLVALGASIGLSPGFGMRRGTLLLASRPAAVLPTFADAGAHDLLVLRLLVGALADRSPALAALGALTRARRLVGDLAAGGQGEILLLEG